MEVLLHSSMTDLYSFIIWATRATKLVKNHVHTSLYFSYQAIKVKALCSIVSALIRESLQERRNKVLFFLIRPLSRGTFSKHNYYRKAKDKRVRFTYFGDVFLSLDSREFMMKLWSNHVVFFNPPLGISLNNTWHLRLHPFWAPKVWKIHELLMMGLKHNISPNYWSEVWCFICWSELILFQHFSTNWSRPFKNPLKICLITVTVYVSKP